MLSKMYQWYGVPGVWLLYVSGESTLQVGFEDRSAEGHRACYAPERDVFELLKQKYYEAGVFQKTDDFAYELQKFAIWVQSQPDKVKEAIMSLENKSINQLNAEETTFKQRNLPIVEDLRLTSSVILFPGSDDEFLSPMQLDVIKDDEECTEYRGVIWISPKNFNKFVADKPIQSAVATLYAEFSAALDVLLHGDVIITEQGFTIGETQMYLKFVARQSK